MAFAAANVRVKSALATINGNLTRQVAKKVISDEARSQALSRSLFAQMIPKDQEAEFYSFYEISERGTSWVGPLLFGLVNQIALNLRPAIFSLIFFFAVGLFALLFVNEKKAIEDARKFEARHRVATSPEAAD